MTRGLVWRLVRWWPTWAILGVLLGALMYVALGGHHSAPRGAAEHVGGIPVSSPPFLGAPKLGWPAPNVALGTVPAVPGPSSGDGAVLTQGSGAPLSPAPLEETVLPTGSTDLTPSTRSLSKPVGMGTDRSRAGSQPSADTGPSAEPPATRPTPRDSQLQTAKPSVAIPHPVAVPDKTARRGAVASPDASACASPCAVSIGRVSFGGLHPILESWYVGVAEGIASHMGAGYPASYLALPIGKGFLVRIVGAGGHVEMRSTDAGPDLQKQREGRVADLSVAVFVKVCGVPASAGLCQVSISVIGKVR